MTVNTIDVKVVSNEQELKEAFAIRRKVFVDEQQVPEEEEIDALESEATHFILSVNGKPAGAGRLRVVEGYGKVERICILKEHRSNGAGKTLMNHIQAITLEKGLHKLKLNAQVAAIPFYTKLGYETVSEEFLDAGIPHKTMVKHL